MSYRKEPSATLQREQSGLTEIVTRTNTVMIDKNGIIWAIAQPKSNQDLADAQENVAAVLQLANGRKRPLLIDIRAVGTVTRQARMYYSGRETASTTLAVALLVASPLSKMLGNFFLGLNKTTFPLKLFTSETDAVYWLKGFVK